MRFQISSLQLIASAVLLPASWAFSITTTNDANALADAIFGQGITILQASFSGAAVSSGTFTEGPFGIGSGAILTSGAAVGALPNGDHYVNNGAPGSSTYCGPNTFNAALLTVDILLDPAYSGVRVEIILASEEEGGSADPIGVFLGNTQYAVANGQRITAVSPYLAQPLVITPPNSVTSYPGSTPPLWIDILTSGTQTMVFAVCDQSDSEWDSGLLLKAQGCTDCDTDVRFAYVTTTTTVAAGEATFTSTTTASGTVSGTIRIGVTADETTTTSAEPTTTTATEEPTTTTTAEETTTTTQETRTTSEEIITTTTTTAPTTTGETRTTTLESSIETTSDEPQTTTSPDTSSEELLATTTTTADTTTLAISDTTTESTSDRTTTRAQTTIDISSAITGPAQESSATSTSAASSVRTLDPVSNTGTTTRIESLETTVVQRTESSTDTIFSSSAGTMGVTSSSNATPSTVEDTPTSATSTVATSSAMPSNLPEIGTFKFFGCLGSPDRYPTFELIAEGSDMTTIECARRGKGRAYVGIYLRSCYAADSLDSTEQVEDGRCDLLCPGDPGLFCGGVVQINPNPESRLNRRDAPSGILLTLYVQTEAVSGSLTTSDVLRTSETGTFDASTATSSLLGSTDNSVLLILTTESSGLPTGIPTIHFSLSSGTESFIDSVTTLEPSIPVTKSQGVRPIIPPYPTTVSYNAGNFTRTEALAPIITTITYTVVDPYNPSQLTVTEFCTTLRSPPCRHCQYQKPPTVEMTTIKVDCNACGHYGENTIILDVPAGVVVAAPTRDQSAHETHRVQHHEPNQWGQNPHPDEGGSQTWQRYQPQNSSPAADNEPYEGGGRYQIDQPKPYHARPTAVESNHEQEEPGVVTKAAPKVIPVGTNDQPEPPKPTFHRRPGPDSTPVAPPSPDAPIVVVSGAAVKTMERVLMMILFMAGLVFLL
ncbi:hypothetical protein F53441_1418 [Fusarium austroafricanum]|uniref:WSC domain-containing protein n=1 Tax=Fusarium austroafricanum TaxID=2364996 RepID=A0A8H4P417_9HYPO|nr:hypothetical protein F53441_1418 [Fusarium austroafricanum]